MMEIKKDSVVEMNDAIKRLLYLLEIVPDQITQLSVADFEYKQSPEKWSRKQIFGHLIDSAVNNHQRFIRIQYEDVPYIVYDQNNWNTLNHYQDLPTEHLIQLWVSINRQLVAVIQQTPIENTQLKCDVGLNEPVTFAYLVVDYVKHLEHHLKQIIVHGYE